MRHPDCPGQLRERLGQFSAGGDGYVRGGRNSCAGSGEPLNGELGVEQPQGEVLAADAGPQCARVDFVFDLALDHQRGLVEPAGPDPQAAPAPFVELAGLHGLGGGIDDDGHLCSQCPYGPSQHAFGSIGQNVGAHHKAAHGAHEDGADQPRQLGGLGPQIQGEEVGREADHPQRDSAWAEPADVDGGKHD